MSIDQLVRNFHKYILACWPQLNLIMENLDWDEDPYFIDNWLQANWELMVEKQLGNSKVILAPYGYDINPDNRYMMSGAPFTHRVICELLDSRDSYFFLEFSTTERGAVKYAPPLDFVAVENQNNKIEYLQLDKVNFSLATIQP